MSFRKLIILTIICGLASACNKDKGSVTEPTASQPQTTQEKAKVTDEVKTEKEEAADVEPIQIEATSQEIAQFEASLSKLPQLKVIKVEPIQPEAAIPQVKEKTTDEIVREIETATGIEASLVGAEKSFVGLYVAQDVDFNQDLELQNEKARTLFILLEGNEGNPDYTKVTMINANGEKTKTPAIIAPYRTSGSFNRRLENRRIELVAGIEIEKTKTGIEIVVSMNNNSNSFLTQRMVFKPVDTKMIETLRKEEVTKAALIDRCLHSKNGFGVKSDYSTLKVEQKGTVMVGKYIVDVVTLKTAKINDTSVSYETIGLITSEDKSVSSCVNDDYSLKINKNRLTRNLSLSGLLLSEDGYSIGFGGMMVKGKFEESNNIFARSAKVEDNSLSGKLSVNKNNKNLGWTIN